MDENADCRFRSLRLDYGGLRLGEDAEDAETRLGQIETRFRSERVGLRQRD